MMFFQTHSAPKVIMEMPRTDDIGTLPMLENDRRVFGLSSSRMQVCFDVCGMRKLRRGNKTNRAQQELKVDTRALRAEVSSRRSREPGIEIRWTSQ
jgi:hypothetical protein